jgi:hypothetical protein
MRNVIVSLAVLAAGAIPGVAAEMGGMGAAKPVTASEPAGFRFEQAAPPKPSGKGKSLVAIRLVHNGKPVAGAIIIQSRADMGPMGMAAMTAPIKPMGEQPAGVYRFEVTNGPVWNKPDLWAVSFSAKVQGVAETVKGSVTVKLSP